MRGAACLRPVPIPYSRQTGDEAHDLSRNPSPGANTAAQIVEVKTDLTDRIDQVETGLNARIDRVEKRLTDRIDRVEGGLGGRIDEVKAELAAGEARRAAMEERLSTGIGRNAAGVAANRAAHRELAGFVRTGRASEPPPETTPPGSAPVQ